MGPQPDASGQKKECAKVVGIENLSDQQGWEKVGKLKASGKIVMEITNPSEPVPFCELGVYYLGHKEWRKESTRKLHAQVINKVLVPQWGKQIAVSIRP